MKELLAISPGNTALEFLDKRIADDNYRGDESSQHNRYIKDKVVAILKLLNKYAPNGTLLTIRNTDISKRPANMLEEAAYAKFCDEVKSITGIGTQDAMRKNLFPDFHRMGFINRYNRKGDKVAPFVHSNIRYVSLSKQGQKLINPKDMEEQLFAFTKGVYSLLGSYIEILFEIFRTSSYKINYITIYEYTFFCLCGEN